MVACITLAQSIIRLSANFPMQYTRTLKKVCLEIEKAQRAFIWGDTETKQKTHLINWATLCLPKVFKGLGFKCLNIMNEAFILKLRQELLTKPN